MYDKVLVPMALDHGISKSTLAIAKLLCAPGGEITALHIYETPHSSVSAYLDEDAVRQGFQSASDRLQEKTAGLEGVTARIEKGHSYRAIVDYAERNNVGCIVIGSHKPGLTDYLLGTTASKVVRHAPCAVHVYRES